ncbi:HD domain-containing protein [Limnochorda pilosa]|uniref:Phosphohydrolase n=1 Tax=Limnochorda pilosa TaxID=1555112 RepID=A0A0K2SNR1_LIMPI|nr:HD domain-containing protein [Limnochorda pilosa]BAS28469.1 phosphohydrolase [Limnochorda pilosa]
MAGRRNGGGERPPSEAGVITLKEVRQHPAIDAYVRQADTHLAAMGYTEHGYRHCGLVSSIAGNILRRLGRPARLVELAEIAGYTHDLGNCASRDRHWVVGAVMVGQILEQLGVPYPEIAVIMGAIGNHEEPEGFPVNDVSAAVILADKTDVHRSRVRNRDLATFDIHDRVNYAVVHSFLDVEPAHKEITLTLKIETEICQVMEYFEIFLSRMVMCRRAAEFLDCRFRLEINGAKLL